MAAAAAAVAVNIVQEVLRGILAGKWAVGFRDRLNGQYADKVKFYGQSYVDNWP